MNRRSFFLAIAKFAAAATMRPLLPSPKFRINPAWRDAEYDVVFLQEHFAPRRFPSSPWLEIMKPGYKFPPDMGETIRRIP